MDVYGCLCMFMCVCMCMNTYVGGYLASAGAGRWQICMDMYVCMCKVAYDCLCACIWMCMTVWCLWICMDTYVCGAKMCMIAYGHVWMCMVCIDMYGYVWLSMHGYVRMDVNEYVCVYLASAPLRPRRGRSGEMADIYGLYVCVKMCMIAYGHA